VQPDALRHAVLDDLPHVDAGRAELPVGAGGHEKDAVELRGLPEAAALEHGLERRHVGGEDDEPRTAHLAADVDALLAELRDDDRYLRIAEVCRATLDDQVLEIGRVIPRRDLARRR